MEIREYRVAIVISPSGINDRQHQWIRYWLAFVAKHLGEGGQVTMLVTGFHGTEAEHYGIPRDIWNKVLPPGCTMKLYPLPVARTTKEEDRALLSMLAIADEIWCLPADRQTGFLNQSRPSRIFRLGLASEQPPRFKWVPPWIEVEAPPSKPVKSKGVKK